LIRCAAGRSRRASLPGNDPPILDCGEKKMADKRKNKQIVAFVDAFPGTEPYSGTLIFMAKT
jgi:hypothetical protein